MFGYIRVAEDELKVRELKKYRNHYCGLCKQIANYSQIARMFLSYDMVFFSLLLEVSPSIETEMCKHKAFIRCRKSCGEEKIRYIAAISIILQYYKIQDDYLDGAKKSIFLLIALHRGIKKASSDYPNLQEQVRTSMNKLHKLENEKSTNFMELEDCFASMFFKFFSTRENGDEYKEVRGRIAYHVAAWVYWFDMYVDIDKDEENGNYNAILLQGNIDIGKEWVYNRLLYHLENAEKLLDLFPYNENIAIMYNIVSIGIPAQMAKIIDQNNGGHN